MISNSVSQSRRENASEGDLSDDVRANAVSLVPARSERKPILQSLLSPKVAATSIAACAAITFAGAMRAGAAESTIYNDTSTTTIAGVSGDNDLFAITIPATGNALKTKYTINSISFCVYDASAFSVYAEINFWQNINLTTVSGATVNSGLITSQSGKFSLPVTDNYQNNIAMTPFVVQASATLPTTIGVQLEYFSSSALTTLLTSSETLLTGVGPTTGTVAYPEITGGTTYDVGWYTSTSGNTFLGQSAQGYAFAATKPAYAYLSIGSTGIFAPTPSSLAVMISGAAPMLGLLRSRRKLSRRRAA